MSTYRLEYFALGRWELARYFDTQAEAERVAENLRLAGFETRTTEVRPLGATVVS